MGTPWITFDCFGTLVDWNRGFSAALSPSFGSRTAEVVRLYHEFERQLEQERPHRLYKDVLATGVSLAATRLKLPVPEGSARALQRAWGSLPVFEDVEEMLAGLRAAGCRLAVLTNCDDDLFEQTQRAFRQPFDLVITAQQVCAYKPALTHFLRFTQASGAVAKDWVHVASSWYHDIAPAKELGIKRIWLDRDATGEDPGAANIQMRSAAEVCSAVKQLLIPG